MVTKGVAIGWAAAGGGLTGLACLSYAFFSPSPHGYGELFVALPLAVLGLAMLGTALVHAPFGRAVRAVGWLTLAVASVPVIVVMVVLVSVLAGLNW